MVIDPSDLVRDFAAAAEKAEIDGWSRQLQDSLRLEYLPAPHSQPQLSTGYGAVYAFALSSRAGESAPCRAGCVLKVGRVGASNRRRFRYSHYLPEGPRSTLARSLVSYPIMWPWLGIDHLDNSSVKQWMLSNLDRLHVF